MTIIEQHRETDGWEYVMHSGDTQPEDFGVFESFKRLWDSKRNGSSIPAWRDFQIRDFEGWYGWFSVDDIIPGPVYDSKFRLWGTNLVHLFGVDYTNRKISDLIGIYITEQEIGWLTEMRETHNLRYCTGPINWSNAVCEWDRRWICLLELPLARDRQNVDSYINVASVVGE